jgi:tetratricopeptide (TPR) repeat protein
VACNKLGDLALALGDLDAARSLFTEALDLRIDIERRQPDRPDTVADLLASHERLSELARRSGQTTDERHHAEEALTLAARLVEKAPHNPEHRLLSGAHGRIGNCMLDAGDLTESHRHVTESVTIHSNLATDSSDRPQLHQELGVGYERLAVVADQANDPDTVLARAQDAINALHRTLALDPDLPHAAIELAGMRLKAALRVRVGVCWDSPGICSAATSVSSRGSATGIGERLRLPG